MKRISVTLLVAIMSAAVFCMTACGKDDKNSSEQTSAPSFSSEVNNPFENSDTVSEDSGAVSDGQESKQEVSSAVSEAVSQEESKDEASQESGMGNIGEESITEVSEEKGKPEEDESSEEEPSQAESKPEESEDDASKDEESKSEESKAEESKDEESKAEESKHEESKTEESRDEESEDEDSENEESKLFPEGSIVKSYVGTWKSDYDLSSFSGSEVEVIREYLSEIRMELVLSDDGKVSVISYYYDRNEEPVQGKWTADGNNIYFDIDGNVMEFIYKDGKIFSESLPYMYFTKS